jgi:hypothetical protein
MESKTTIPDIKLTIQSGGSLVFEKTEILPEFLIFHSKQLHRNWRLKLKKNKQNGVLKVNGQIAFHYFFVDLGCKMQSVDCGVVTGEWDIEEIMMEMLD